MLKEGMSKRDTLVGIMYSYLDAPPLGATTCRQDSCHNRKLPRCNETFSQGFLVMETEADNTSDSGRSIQSFPGPGETFGLSVDLSVLAARRSGQVEVETAVGG